MFDVAQRLVVLDIEAGVVAGREEKTLEADPLRKVKGLEALGLSVLVCGAISETLGVLITQSGVQVIPNICGSLDEVAEAFLNGQLTEGNFGMPGCCRRRHRLGGCRRRNSKMSRSEGNKS